MSTRDNDKAARNRSPRKGQFRKGVSGNPKGRPKGTRNLKTDLLEELSEPITIREDGKSRRISKQRAMIKGAVARAIQGDQRALANVASLMIKVIGDDIKNEQCVGLDDTQRTIMKRFKDRVRDEVLAEMQQKEAGRE